jgi:hypothetical protein
LRYKARLKTLDQACEDSDHFEKLGSGSYILWHPFGKHLTVRSSAFDMFDQEVMVSCRDTNKMPRTGQIKRIYNVNSIDGNKSMVAYDYWFLWINDGKTPIIQLEEDLFEI